MCMYKNNKKQQLRFFFFLALFLNLMAVCSAFLITPVKQSDERLQDRVKKQQLGVSARLKRQNRFSAESNISALVFISHAHAVLYRGNLCTRRSLSLMSEVPVHLQHLRKQKFHFRFCLCLNHKNYNPLSFLPFKIISFFFTLNFSSFQKFFDVASFFLTQILRCLISILSATSCSRFLEYSIAR